MADVLSLLIFGGQVALSVTLIALALLSRRLGRVTGARRYYLGLYIAAALITIGALVRLLANLSLLAQNPYSGDNGVYILLAYGLPALGLTLALLVTWYYWSWLLAERD